MARCLLRSTLSALMNSPLGLTRQAIWPCQQYPRAFRGLELIQTRQHVSHASVGRMFMVGDNRTSAGEVEGNLNN
jgi:hypothetical protein